jgi:hypothetical protein
VQERLRKYNRLAMEDAARHHRTRVEAERRVANTTPAPAHTSLSAIGVRLGSTVKAVRRRIT